MRHVLSGIAGLVIAPVAWLLYTLGSGHFMEHFSRTFDSMSGAPWLLLPIAAGLLLGLVGTLRISPVGALVAGVTYLLLQIALVVTPLNVAGTLEDVSRLVLPPGAFMNSLYNGSFGLVGGILVVAAFSGQRWRAPEKSGNATTGGIPTPSQPGFAGYPAPPGVPGAGAPATQPDWPASPAPAPAGHDTPQPITERGTPTGPAGTSEGTPFPGYDQPPGAPPGPPAGHGHTPA